MSRLQNANTGSKIETTLKGPPMSAVPVLVYTDVQSFIQDSPATNYLLDNYEFTQTRIELAISIALSEANMVPPRTTYTVFSFPSQGLLLDGTLWKLFEGQAAFYARSSLPISDGGLVVPIEEKFESYTAMAAQFKANFLDGLNRMKVENNMEGAWDTLYSDYSGFPWF